MLALSDEQQMVVSSLEQLAEQEFADKAFTWEGEPPMENVELLAEQGFLGINIAEEYGGGGMSEFEAMLTIEAVGRVCPDTAEYLYNQQMVAPRAIEMFGSEAVKERYLPGVTAGETSVAVAISEPEAGSDVGSMSTTVEERDGELVLNGEKIWVSHVEQADAAVVWAKFPEGLGSLVLDLDDDGVEIAQHYTNMADHVQTQFYMEDIVVPEENVLTRGKEGFKDQLKALNWERLGSATLSNAIAGCAIDHALEYAQQREQFGQPIGDFQGIEWKLADMVKQLEGSRALTYRAAVNAHEQGRIPDRLDASIAKLTSGEMVEDVVSEALQIHGANGYQREHPLEYLYRVARGRRLAAGTDEIQKNTIASVLKSDGLPSLT
ncbi:acyl-CoA dehydrogenase domain protein (plasmid) [Haloterrigena turkmenica DSM 5511]|uniref:Acyl-CoA dehydrogenase domain protein n=1 Tax=Haloterrigena turkmenica (strain ATCC 51198 / DSM 5511 / JCM 9101 / NCIMB 13204 / VKM B-1734 / 4k) TaxID=543526 RepID=D2RZU8_HALTV|nr:acyl-CoA dehydrogenase family protein [Haloterrigena turkmenica]ADB62645.1 acyl-CoA dehydrogenase domain protein [Haloterrigena turkmenica DSM 5511]